MAAQVSEYDREHISEIMGGHGDWFSAQLLRLLQKADLSTRDQVRQGFPDHVKLYEDWLLSGPPPATPIENFSIPYKMIFRALEVLRLTHIYALKDSHLEELPSDFKPHKWTNEIEFAQESIDTYRELLNHMTENP